MLSTDSIATNYPVLHVLSFHLNYFRFGVENSLKDGFIFQSRLFKNFF